MKLFYTLCFLFASVFAFAQNPCGLSYTVQTGNCTSNTAYEVWVNYTLHNASPSTKLLVYANGQSLGEFALTSTNQLYFPSFPYNGGVNDVVKVCVVDHPDCCLVKEFPVPACLSQPTCQITMTATTGDCTGDSTYQLNAQVQIISPISSANTYQVWINGALIGTYPITQTSISISNAHWNGGANDEIKVCLTNHPDCCKTIEYHVPACLTTPPVTCHIALEAITGDCTSDSTYALKVQAQVLPASATGTYQLWLNGHLVGTYPVSQTTVLIPNALWNGGTHDIVKVCLTNHPDCCKEVEFAVPACITNPPHPCLIDGLSVEVLDCVNDSTFIVKINFTPISPTNTYYEVWNGNGTYLGYYPLTQLPLTLTIHGVAGAHGAIKVCINDNPNCCRVKEFTFPTCHHPCSIHHLNATHTPCLCGQFFAVLSFQTSQPGTAQYTVVGNGTTYGPFAYAQNPVIIGPLQGDGLTNYKFLVQDVLNPDCKSDVSMGIIACPIFANNKPLLKVSPNPASGYVEVTCPSAALDAQALLEITNSLGQIVLSKTMQNESTVYCNISTLPKGKYQVQVQWAGGSAAGQFVKVE
jgi:Secretion system C-terminal sorting domain